MFSSGSDSKLSPKLEHRRQRPSGRFQPNPKARWRDQLHEVMRFFHYSERTEETYWQWIYRFLKFHRRGNATDRANGAGGRAEAGTTNGWRRPQTMGAVEVEAYLSHLASVEKVAAATRKQALHPVR